MRDGERRINTAGRAKRRMKTPLDFDEAAEERKIVAFIRSVTKQAAATGVVVGLSGGVDSSVVCALCTRALGKGRVLGVLMPSASTPSVDVSDAKELASSLGIEIREARIDGVVESVLAVLGIEGSKIARANLQARTRMMVLYFYANTLGRLVAGTGDKSEILVGFFTKYGDGGVDFLPIGHLYKTQVRRLGKRLGLPRRILEKPPSPQLWPGHKATDELPADYDRLDLILHYVLESRLSAAQAASRAGADASVVGRVLEMNRRSAHKRAPPPGLRSRGESS
ncbi:MAG TPA: NAD+ synthase [Nitrososphaerales archaeon]|nr:NAD+ synthase [Nitrososphaerales archaeon]